MSSKLQRKKEISFNTHPSSAQRRLVVIIHAASIVIFFPPPLEINPSTLISVPPSVHTLLILRTSLSIFERTTNPFSKNVYVYVYIYIYIYMHPSKLVFAFCRRHYLDPETLLGYFSRNNRGEINFYRYLPEFFPPSWPWKKRDALSWHGFEEYRGCKVSRDVNTIKARVAAK